MRPSDARDYVSLLAGERLGAGVVVDGRLLRGAHGGAGEMVFLDDIPAVGGAWGLGFRAAEWAREAIESGERRPDSGLLDVCRPSSWTPRRCSPSPGRATPTPAASSIASALALATIVGHLRQPVRRLARRGLGRDLGGSRRRPRRRARGERRRTSTCRCPRLVASPLGADVVAIGAVARARDAARADVAALTRVARPPRAEAARDATTDAATESIGRGIPSVFEL